MITFLAIAAFFMAFGALWFTSEIARRTDALGQSAVKPHVTPLEKAISRAEMQISELTLGLEAAEKNIQALKAEKLERDKILGFETPPNAVNLQPSTLDILRRNQKFYPSETYNA